MIDWFRGYSVFTVHFARLFLETDYTYGFEFLEKMFDSYRTLDISYGFSITAYHAIGLIAKFQIIIIIIKSVPTLCDCSAITIVLKCVKLLRSILHVFFVFETQPCCLTC